MSNEELYKNLAKYEIGWWKAHHRKNKPLLIEQMAKLYELQFNIPYSSALNAVEYRVKATREHDIAEKFEDEGNQKKADIHWTKAEELLLSHFKILDSLKK